MSENPYFVVIDTETTGFGKSDRIVEISAIVLDIERGEVVDEFDTLINPMRDISNSHIHGVTASMVSAAPTFQEVATGLGSLLEGNFLVAHNLPFDSRFLNQEFAKVGSSFDAGRGVCTLQLTHEKLASACARFGIRMEQAHRSLSDARATAELLIKALDEVPDDISGMHFEDLVGEWVPRTFRREHAEGAPIQATVHSRRNLIFPTSIPSRVCYLDVLDFYLQDLVLDEFERSELNHLASEFSIGVDEQAELHRSYLNSVVVGAKRDGVITPEEFEVMAAVAYALGVNNFEIPEIGNGNQGVPTSGGERVCFTGEVRHGGRPYPREELEVRAAMLGMIPVGSVTKKNCDLVVAADPMSMSGKAKKARDFGIPVVGPLEVPGLLD